MHDGAVAQKAAARHHQWTKGVYERINTAIAAAVDHSFEQTHRARQEAFAEYLQHSNSGGGVFLDGHESARPMAATAQQTVRAVVRISDPCKALRDKAISEAQTLDAGMGASRVSALRHSRHREMRPAALWTRAAMEATPAGHFEHVELLGAGFDMAFSGRDTHSDVNWYDFEDPSQTLTRSATGRIKEIDADFPRPQKRVEGWEQRKSVQETAGTVRHPISRKIYGPEDGVFTDAALQEDVRPTVMAGVK